jgi:hypothetical protein
MDNAIELFSALKQTDAIKRAEKGDHSALPEVRAAFDAHPKAVNELGDLGRVTLDQMVNTFAGDHLVLREAQERFLAQLEKDLAGPNPTPLERILVQEIVVCKQELNVAEIHFATVKKCSITEGDYHQRRIDRAQKRFLAAVKTLAQVRRLQLPAVQVNVATQGGQQVNVAPAGR